MFKKIDKALEVFKKNPDIQPQKVADITGCSIRTAYNAQAEYRLSDEAKFSDSVSGPNRNIVSTSSLIRTLDQLLKYCRVNMKVWEVSKHTINSWGSGTNKNFQVKAWLKQRGDELSIVELRNEFVDSIKNHCPEYKPKEHSVNKSGNAAEISIHDLHFGSLCWEPETGANYDIKIAEKIFMDAVKNLISHINTYNPEKIVFPIGSDFFNVNSKLNTTAAGTPQDEDARWQKTFVYGRRMTVKAVDMLRNIAPVEVMIIPGNHDLERAFYLGESLLGWYRNCPDVNVDNSPTTRKYWNWGKCLVGFTHGQAEVKGTLPMLMATERPGLWAISKFREFHTGHLHHRASKSYDYGTESNGVREKILPSLASTDSWHSKKGYSGLRSAEAFIWNKNNGNIANFSYQP